MVMIGNIVKSGRPSRESMKRGICSCCHEPAEEVGIDNSFSDSFGWVEDWDVGSSCCEAEVVDGQVFMDKTTYHVARKDHLDDDGNVVIPKGRRYRAHLKKGWYDDDGVRKGIFEYSKVLLKED